MNLDDYIFSDDPTDPVDPVDPPQDDPIIDDPAPIDDPADPDDEPIVDEEAEAYFEFLKANEILDVPDDFKFDGSADSIQQALEVTKQNLQTKIATNIWNQLPDDFKPLLEYALSGGKSLDDFLAAHAPLDFDEANLDDVITQKAVLRTYYKEVNPNYKDDKIDRMITSLEKMGEDSLKEEAVEAIDYLRKLKEDRQNELIQKAKEDEQARKVEAQKRATEITKLIDESKSDSLRKNRLKNILFLPVEKNGKTTTEFNASLDSILQNPEHLIQFAELVADYDPRVGFNFSRLSKQINTQSTTKFRDLVQAKLGDKITIKGNPAKQKDDLDLSQWLQN